jgi:hypothetical protein
MENTGIGLNLPRKMMQRNKGYPKIRELPCYGFHQMISDQNLFSKAEQYKFSTPGAFYLTEA